MNLNHKMEFFSETHVIERREEDQSCRRNITKTRGRELGHGEPKNMPTIHIIARAYAKGFLLRLKYIWRHARSMPKKSFPHGVNVQPSYGYRRVVDRVRNLHHRSMS
jgi:hypothetical protein